MTVNIRCDCGKQFRANPNLAGRQLPCPFCGQMHSLAPLERPADSSSAPVPQPASTEGKQDQNAQRAMIVGAIVVALLLAGLLYLLIQRTQLGAAIRASAQEPEGAELVGIDVHRIYTITFGIGAACVGAAGALVLPFLFVSPTAGDTFTIIAFVVVVLGGMGSIPGALIGGLVIGLTQELTQLFVPGSKFLGVFVVFLAVLFFRPEGILGRVRR